tara:strand:- start:280 stop:426 length:147 start_codon:yes stop_codon:yes gene_type:complete
MKDQSEFEEISNTYSNKASEISDYDFLLSKLKDIKDSITLLENYILYK